MNYECSCGSNKKLWRRYRSLDSNVYCENCLLSLFKSNDQKYACDLINRCRNIDELIRNKLNSSIFEIFDEWRLLLGASGLWGFVPAILDLEKSRFYYFSELIMDQTIFPKWFAVNEKIFTSIGLLK